MDDARSMTAEVHRLIEAGRLNRARELCERLVKMQPRSAEMHALFSAVALRQQDMPAAQEHADKALELAPDHAGVVTHAGVLHFTSGRLDQAIELMEKAAVLAPAHPGIRINLCQMHFDKRQLRRAMVHTDAALAIDPASPAFITRKATLLQNLGRGEESRRLLEDALQRVAPPASAMIAEMLASNLNYLPDQDAGAVFAAHRRAGDLIEGTVRRLPLVRCADRPNGSGADGRLRLGVLSSDLRGHSVGYFAECLLRHLDRGAFDVLVYNTSEREDDKMAVLRALEPNWKDHLQTPPEELARVIRADRVDILLDLHGFTMQHRLQTVACRPAPLQVTYAGYPNTPGMRSIDYRVVSSITDPPGPLGGVDGRPSPDDLSVERLVRLDPSFLCYTPPQPADLTDVAPLPVRHDPAAEGRLTLGCLNAIMKINEPTLRVWAQILARLPEARLLIKNASMLGPDGPAELSARFDAVGVDPGRLVIIGEWPQRREHLRTYHRVDLALDTFPYNGCTTTFESLLMGVPVVSRAGEAHCARMGLMILSALGLEDLLVARSAEEYVDKVVALAGDHDRLAELRAGLRQRLLASPLCDGPGFADRFGRMLKDLWQQAVAQG